jgi:uncharacterized protein
MEGRTMQWEALDTHCFPWFNLSAAGSKGTEQEHAASRRDAVAKKMTRQQVAEAQRLAREWKPKRAKQRNLDTHFLRI